MALFSNRAAPLTLEETIARSPSLHRAVHGATPAERADRVLTELALRPTLEAGQTFRRLAGEVRRQRELPRDAERDGRFLFHLEHALRDCSIEFAGAR